MMRHTIGIGKGHFVIVGIPKAEVRFTDVDIASCVRPIMFTTRICRPSKQSGMIFNLSQYFKHQIQKLFLFSLFFFTLYYFAVQKGSKIKFNCN